MGAIFGHPRDRPPTSPTGETTDSQGLKRFQLGSPRSFSSAKKKNIRTGGRFGLVAKILGFVLFGDAAFGLVRFPNFEFVTQHRFQVPKDPRSMGLEDETILSLCHFSEVKLMSGFRDFYPPKTQDDNFLVTTEITVVRFLDIWGIPNEEP